VRIAQWSGCVGILRLLSKSISIGVISAGGGVKADDAKGFKDRGRENEW